MTAWGVLLFTGGCLVAVLSGLIKDEIRGWLDLVPHGILRLAALLLESSQRKTIYEDEWVPELYHILLKADTRPISAALYWHSFLSWPAGISPWHFPSD